MKKKLPIPISFLTAALAFACLGWPLSSYSDNKSIMGWIEYVNLHPLEFRVKAKLDTGAKTSSMHAEDIELFKRDGDTWVRFTFEAKHYDPHKKGESKLRRVTLERKRVRNVIIKRHNVKYQERPVVKMTLCINGKLHTEQFSLIDRSRFLYPVLLGRKALKDIALVDSGETFLTSGICIEDDNDN